MDLYLVLALLFVIVFVAGWKCAVAWHSRKRPLPSPLQRAVCSDRMGRHRQKVSESHDEAFFSGVDIGQKITRH